MPKELRDLRGTDEGLFLFDPHREYEYIRIWVWGHAPPNLKKFSTHGGDEDGIIWVPNKFLQGDECPSWVENIWRVYGDDQDFIRFHDGLIIIWAHS